MLEPSRSRRPSWMTPYGREGWGDVFSDRLWPEWPRRAGGESWRPRTNVYERDGKYYLEMEVPGISKEEISVNIDKGILTISGKKVCKEGPEDVAYYLRECMYGSFSRSIRLPLEVDEESVAGQFENGVLTVEMPTVEEMDVRKIDIRTE